MNNKKVNTNQNLNTNQTNYSKNNNSNNINFSNKGKSFWPTCLNKIKNFFKSYNSFVIKNENKIYSYYLYISILIFIGMFFVSIFINANLGYSLNGVLLEWNYGLVTAGIVVGSICLILYLPIFVLSITQFVNMIKNKKFDFMFYWMIFIQLFNLYAFLTAIIYSILNYKLFFIHEILYIFMLVAFWSLNNKIKINFKKFNVKDWSNKVNKIK